MSILYIAPPDMPVINMETSAFSPMVVSSTNEVEFAEGGRSIDLEKSVDMSTYTKKSVLT
jgi:hypothetical protein